MLERLYFAVWGLYLLIVGTFYITGNLTAFTTVVLGFVFFGLTFMGMIGVLPFYVTHQKMPLKH
jgi:hypothetical protein